ncbi:MAG TPA: tetratricopeptide repeat protein [Methylomirabilota bacterium]|nr:tetratricopeptide repeat protein [Methylomirabilota bacterium]
MSGVAVGRRRLAIPLALLAIAAACSRPEPGPTLLSPAAEPPSFLLITLDTTRPDRLEPYGAVDVETPALAALARDGVVFDHAVATTPVTAPSHASLLTGLYPPRHGVHNNSTHHLGEGALTLAERLAGAGYRTAAFVSTVILDHRYGLGQGFQVYDDDIRSATPSGVQRRMTVDRPADATTDRALDWLDGLDGGAPFFLWVHYYDPHIPYAPPPPFDERYSGRPYDGEVAFMDSQIGRLLEHPAVAAGRVVVAAVADHGESLGEHGERTHGLLVYDSTLRVPFILRLPGGPRGLRVSAPVSLVDLAPTFAELAALPPEVDPPDGRSLLPLLNAGAPGDASDRMVFAESQVPFLAYGWSPLRSVRRGWLKLIDAPTVELYDLAGDPGELDNLAPRRPAEVARLAAELEAWEAAGGAASTLEVDPETARELRALGYVAGDPERPEGEGRGNPVELMPVHDQLQEVGELLSAGRPEEAVLGVRRALQADPNNLAALRDLSRGLVLLGRLDEAAAAAARASAAAPWSARALAIEADIEHRRGNPRRALELVERALALDDRFLEARIDRARYLAAVGRSDEARAELAALLAQAPDDNWVALRTAELVELAAGDADAAERRLRQVLDRNPTFTEATLLLGTILSDQGRLDEAAAVYREAVEMGTASPTVHARLAVLAAAGSLQRGDPAGAAASARSAVETDPSSAVAWNTLAVALDELGRKDEAEAAYRRAAELDPTDWRALFNLGILLREAGRPDEAAAVQEQVLARSPGNAGAHFELGVLWAAFLGDAERARSHLRAAVDADPSHPRAEQARMLLDRLGPGG